MGKISGQQAQEALDKWDAYIAEYQTGLAVKKTQMEAILNSPSATQEEKDNARQTYEIQKAHLDELQFKRSQLQIQFDNDGEIDDTITFGVNGKMATFVYQTEVGGQKYTGYARNAWPPNVFVSSQHFNLYFETTGTWGLISDIGTTILKFGIESVGYNVKTYQMKDLNHYSPDTSVSTIYGSPGTYYGVSVRVNYNADDVIPEGTQLYGHYFMSGILVELPNDTVPTESPWDYYNDDLESILDDPNIEVFPGGYEEPTDPNNDAPDPEDEGFPDKSEINMDDGSLPDFNTFTTKQGSMTNFCVLTPAEYRAFRATLAQTVKDSMNNDGQGSGLKTTFMYLLGKVKKDMNDQAEYETAENNFIKDYIVSCRVYPFALTDVKLAQYPVVTMAQGDYTDIPFGFNGASITQHNLGLTNTHALTMATSILVPNSNPDPNKQMDVGACTFLDYEPYSKYTLVLPFVGEVELSSHDVLCSRLYIQYAVDFTTGTCLAMVWKTNVSGVAGYSQAVTDPYPLLPGQILLAAKTTTIGASMSIAGNDIVRQADQMNAAYVNQRLNRSVNALKQVEAIMPSKKQVETAMKNGGFQTALKDYALDQVLKIPQNMEMMAQIRASDLLSQIDVSQASRDVPFNMQGGSNPSVLSHWENPYMRIERASWFRPKGYAHTFGYPFEDSVAISEIDGFFQCSNPDVSGIAATEIEQKMINDALREGSYHKKATEE